MKSITTPLNYESIKSLKAGDEVRLSGVIYTARDQAHKRLMTLIKNNKKLPVDLQKQIIYYCGPTKTPKGKIIGSCGPTTSLRMDLFVEPLLKKGILGMIGKGRRSKLVHDLIKSHKAVYFLAPSGCGALLSEFVVSKETVAFKDLGPEALRKLTVKNFPLIVGIDSNGCGLFSQFTAKI